MQFPTSKAYKALTPITRDPNGPTPGYPLTRLHILTQSKKTRLSELKLKEKKA